MKVKTLIIAILLALWSVIPVYWIVNQAFETRPEIYTIPPYLVPPTPSACNILTALGLSKCALNFGSLGGLGISVPVLGRPGEQVYCGHERDGPDGDPLRACRVRLRPFQLPSQERDILRDTLLALAASRSDRDSLLPALPESGPLGDDPGTHTRGHDADRASDDLGAIGVLWFASCGHR